MGILFGYLSLFFFLLSSPERESKKKISLSSFFFLFFFWFAELSFWSLVQQQLRPPPAKKKKEEGGFLWGDFYFCDHAPCRRVPVSRGARSKTGTRVSTTKKKVNNRSRSRGTFCLDFLLLLLLPRSLSRSFSLSSIWRASSVKARLSTIFIRCRL